MKRQDLIDAVNLIADYVRQSIPGGYTVRLDMRRDEASISLFDAEETDTGFHPTGDDSSIIEACDLACELFEETSE